MNAQNPDAHIHTCDIYTNKKCQVITDNSVSQICSNLQIHV